MTRLLVGLMAAVFVLVSSNEARAWDGIVGGTIDRLDVVTVGENYGYRVFLQGLPAMCGTVHPWAYLNKSNDNYDAMVAVLTAAFLSGKQVTVFSNRNATDYCQIGYISVQK